MKSLHRYAIVVVALLAAIVAMPVAAQAGVTVNPTTVNVEEGGATDTYTVVLDEEPTANVTIHITDDAECDVSPAELTFTDADWDTPQEVTVTAVDDDEVEGEHTCTITHHAASTDTNYNDLIPDPVEGTITDNDFAPVVFNLLTPQNNILVRDANALTEFTWEDAGEPVVGYRFVLMQVSGNVRLGTVVDDIVLAATACDGTECAYDATSVTPLDEGQYAWTVEALAALEVVVIARANGSVEASNGPFYFTVFEGAIEFITNGGFEEGVDKVATGWEGKRKCTPDDLTKPNTGECYFQGKPDRPAKGKGPEFMVQTIGGGYVDDLSDGDTLEFSLYIRATAAAGKSAQVVLKYSDPLAGVKGNGKDKVKVTVEADTTGYELFAEPVAVDSEVTQIKVKLGSKLAKVRIDDVSLVWPAVEAVPPRDLLPVPAAP